MYLYATAQGWIKEIPDHLKTQRLCDEAMCINPYSLQFVPQFVPWLLKYVRDQYKTMKMCEKAAEDESYTPQFTSDPFNPIKPRLFQARVSPRGVDHFCPRQKNPYSSSSIYS